MTDQTTPAPTLWALLIGVDCYMGHTIPGLPNYRSLSGCVNDISLMDDFLRTRLDVPAERIKKLTASGLGVEPQEPRDLWPTKANIVAAFKDLAENAQPGDQVYIHYSGHGGQAVTIYPKVKGEDGLDELLVPTDYGQIENKEQPEDRYVRDLELAVLLQALVDRGLIVTAVLDSCHSGGASRGAGDALEEDNARGEDESAVRGGLEPDRIKRTPSDLVASPEALVAGWQEQMRGTRSASVAAGWLPDPDGYTLLASCRALELAREYRTPNGKRQGALSYWLWHTLQSPGLNWEMVHQQVVARVHGAYASQTPQLQGVGDRAVFGGASLALPIGVNVLEVKGDQLRLNIGQAGGLGVGAQYFVYRNGVTDFKLTDQRLAVVELTEVMDVESWAKVVRRLDDSVAIQPGAQALLFDPGKGQQRAVRLVHDGRAPADVEEAALASLAAALQQLESRFVRLAADGESAALLVGVTEMKAYEIRDDSGEPLPNLRPVAVDEPVEVAHRLEHVAKYFNVLELGSPDSMSRLSGKLEVKLMRTPEEPFDEPGGIPTVKESEQIYYLRIRNLFERLEGPFVDDEEVRRRTMNVTVLNLAPEWSIQRLIPADDQKQFELGPGETLQVPRWDLPGHPMGLPALSSSVPVGTTEAVDILKVFATTDTTSYDSLQLPSLEDVAKRALLVGAPKTQEPERSWITTQVMVRAIK